MNKIPRVQDGSANKRHRRTSANRLAIPRTVEQYLALPRRSQETWNRLTEAIAKMRSSLSLQQAAKESRISPRTVRRLAQSALKKGPGGRYSIKNDRLLKVMKIPTTDGHRDIGVLGSRQASRLGQYWAALGKFLNTGDPSGIENFRGKTIRDSTGEIVPLLTDLKELTRQGNAGVLRFESIYAG